MVSAIIATFFLLIVTLQVAYPDNTILPVLFVIALIALGIAVPASLKWTVRLERDDTVQPE